MGTRRLRALNSQPRSATMSRACHLEKQETLDSHSTQELGPLLELSPAWDLPAPGRAQATRPLSAKSPNPKQYTSETNRNHSWHT